MQRKLSCSLNQMIRIAFPWGKVRTALDSAICKCITIEHLWLLAYTGEDNWKFG